jgi:hypothetical protein
MAEKRKTLADPEEFAIVKSIYFPKDNRGEENIDPIEKLERMEAKQRNQNNNSR